MSIGLLRRNRNYRLLLTATGISTLGDGVSALAFPWLATLLTRDPLLIAALSVAGQLPLFLFALPAGVMIDRADRQRIMVRADLFRMALTFGIVGLILTLPSLPPPGGALPVIAALAMLSFLLGSAGVLRENAAQTALPAVVARADLEAANGQLWSVEQVMRAFAGPPLAGVLIGVSVALPFGLDAVSFALAAALVAALVLAPRELMAPARRFRTELAEGLTWLTSQPFLLRLGLMLGGLNALSSAALTMLVLYSREVLHLDAAGYGLLMAAGAAGGVLGGLTGPALTRALGATRSLHLALFACVAGYALLAFGQSAALAAAALFIDAFAGIAWNIVTVSYRQRVIPDAMMGRVNGVYRFLGLGPMPLGALAGGLAVSMTAPWLGRTLALHMPYVLATAGSLLLLLYGMARLRVPEG
ncbi:MAG: MFS transporter [Paracoccaceae bacterium]|nr:MFS transporter [Paracoccaceae bacterium]